MKKVLTVALCLLAHKLLIAQQVRTTETYSGYQKTLFIPSKTFKKSETNNTFTVPLLLITAGLYSISDNDILSKY